MANPITQGGHTSDQSIYETYSLTHSNLTWPQGLHPTGTRGVLSDGRVFYYGSNSNAGALTLGQLCQSNSTAALILTHADHDNITLTNAGELAAVGSERITIAEGDVSTTDIVRNRYAEGTIWVNDADGEGQGFKIRRHDPVDASGTNTLRHFYIYDQVITALAATSQVSLARNPYSAVEIGDGNEEELAAGVPLVTMAASGAMATTVDAAEADITTVFGWFQTWGPCPVKDGDGSLLQGMPVMASTTGGAVEQLVHVTGAASNTHARMQVGNVISLTGAATETALIDLRIRP